MLRLIASLGATIVLCIAIGSQTATDQTSRTLQAFELWSAFGGDDTYPGHCCIDFGWCDGTATSCSGWNESVCYTHTQLSFFAGNKKTCSGTAMPQIVCVHSGGYYYCKIITVCEWDWDADDCRLSSWWTGTSMPNQCAPNCT